MRYPIMYDDEATVRALVDGIAAELRDGWAVERWEPRPGSNPLFLIVKDHLRILAHHKTHSQCASGRLTLTGMSPRAMLGDYDCDRGPSIIATMTRTPRSVTKQLVRNLLPHYTAQAASTIQFDQEQAELAARITRLAEDLAARLPNSGLRPPQLVRQNRTVGFGRRPGPRGALTVYASDTGFSLGITFDPDKTCDPEFVEDLITFIKEHYG